MPANKNIYVLYISVFYRGVCPVSSLITFFFLIHFLKHDFLELSQHWLWSDLLSFIFCIYYITVLNHFLKKNCWVILIQPASENGR